MSHRTKKEIGDYGNSHKKSDLTSEISEIEINFFKKIEEILGTN
ncbi:MAG: hypothetical protein PHS49_04990 [Candidatus Gracilibacteria bacterium]|nr:hypothetical protein [Candidatus Gracilibacteria bacterium]